MKLLLFSDVHGSLRHCRQIVEKSTSVDVVIGAGDFGNFRQGLPPVIDALSAIACPTVLVPGNSESLEELIAACANWTTANVLHGSGTTLSGRHFYGLGGGIPVTPFGSWSYDFTEQEATQLLSECPPGAILISHSPPKGAVDISSSGRSLGSTALRNMILERPPNLVVCGHIHHSAGQSAYIDSTPVVNAGPEGMIWELPE